MTWGFPCTDISGAGKQKGFIDENGKQTRSGLYYEGIRILQEKKPRYSIIENVKALTQKKFKAEFEQILKDLELVGYNNYWKVLNAKDYGIPQNRERVFIISIRKDIDDGNFKFSEGFDNGIRLKDLLESEVDEKYYISQDKTEKLLAKFNEEQAKKGLKNNMVLDAKNAFGGIKTFEGICPTLLTNDFKEPKKVVTFNRKDGIKNEIDNAHSLNASDWRGLNRNQDQNAVVEVRPCLTPDRVEKRQNGRRFKEDGEPAFTLTSQDKHEILEIAMQINHGAVKIKEDDICSCIDANYYKGLDNHAARTGIMQIGMLDIKGNEQVRRVYDPEGLSPTLNTMQGGNRQPKIIIENINNELIQVGMLEGKGFETRRRVYSPEGLSPTLHGIGSGGNTEPKILENNELKFVGGIDTTEKWIENDKDLSRNYKEGYRVYDSEGIACCQKTNGGGLGSNTGLYLENTYRIRKLTPLECFRLMGFDDGDYYILEENGISNSQIYKMAGNSIVVNGLEEIFKALFQNT